MNYDNLWLLLMFVSMDLLGIKLWMLWLVMLDVINRFLVLLCIGMGFMMFLIRIMMRLVVNQNRFRLIFMLRRFVVH